MRRSLGFWRTWGLVVGSAIGSAVFLLPALLVPYGNLSLVGWVMSAVGMLFVALSLGALARRIPRIGGPYAYTRAAFGDLPAFLVAWSFWVSVSTGVAAIAVAFSGYMGVFVPPLASVPAAGAAGAIAVLWMLTALNVAGVSTAATVNLVLTLLKLLPLLAVGAAGLFLGDIAAVPPVDSEGQPFLLFFGGLFVLTMGAYVGIEAGTIPADDVIAPDRTIPRALVIGTLTIAVIYVFATAGVMALVPAPELAQSSSPFAAAALSVFGPWGSHLVTVGAIISIVGVLNATILLTGQMPRAAALDGLFPARFTGLNTRGAPAFALIVSSGLATLLVGMNYTNGIVAAYEILFLLTTLTAIVVYAASAAADLVLQKRDATGGKALRWQSVLIAASALTVSIFAMVGAGLEIMGYTLVLLVAGLPFYFWFRKGTELHSSARRGAGDA